MEAASPIDVFISHSAKDKLAADAVVAGLEQESIRCWVAPRDVLPGTIWAEAIVDAIESAPIMVLLLSGSSNGSRQVLLEVERAVATDTVIVPVRLEKIDPTGAMALFLGSEHWLDAVTPPLEAHIARLASTVRALLGAEPAPVPEEPPPTPRAGSASAWRRPIVLGGLAMVAVVVLGLLFLVVGGGGEDTGSDLVASEAQPTADQSGDDDVSEEHDPPATTTAPGAAPPAFDVPTGTPAEVVQAGNRWMQAHDADLDSVADQMRALAVDAQSEWATTLDQPEAQELAQLASPGLCQLTEDGLAPDDITATLATAASEVSGAPTADYEFSAWATRVATGGVCPEHEVTWAIASGGLGAGVLLADDFEDGAAGWPTGSFDAGSIEARDGVLAFRSDGSSYILGSLYEEAEARAKFPDAVIDVWARQVSGAASSAASYGVSCRETPTSLFGTFYNFTITAAGDFEIWQYEHDGSSNLLDAGPSDAINRIPASNHLTVMCSGSLLALVVNGEVVSVVSDPTLDNGAISLWAAAAIPAVEVEFDDFIVRAPSDEAVSLLDAAGWDVSGAQDDAPTA